MTVLLKNLLARTPNTQDLAALATLVRLCEVSENSTTGGALEGLLSEWQRPDFHFSNDAWVIVTTAGQLVGFACVWHEEYTRITTFLCVHPDYRKRGIGTLLLRMVEMRARQYMRRAPSSERVILQGLINGANAGAQRLFESEGYQAGQPFLRLSFTLNEESGLPDLPLTPRKLTVDVGPGQQNQALAVPTSSEQDVLYNIHVYHTYEKELRPAVYPVAADLQAVGA